MDAGLSTRLNRIATLPTGGTPSWSIGCSSLRSHGALLFMGNLNTSAGALSLVYYNAGSGSLYSVEVTNLSLVEFTATINSSTLTVKSSSSNWGYCGIYHV